jgi:hypothetical protein
MPLGTPLPLRAPSMNRVASRLEVLAEMVSCWDRLTATVYVVMVKSNGGTRTNGGLVVMEDRLASDAARTHTHTHNTIEWAQETTGRNHSTRESRKERTQKDGRIDNRAITHAKDDTAGHEDGPSVTESGDSGHDRSGITAAVTVPPRVVARIKPDLCVAALHRHCGGLIAPHRVGVTGQRTLSVVAVMEHRVSRHTILRSITHVTHITQTKPNTQKGKAIRQQPKVTNTERERALEPWAYRCHHQLHRIKRWGVVPKQRVIVPSDHSAVRGSERRLPQIAVAHKRRAVG